MVTLINDMLDVSRIEGGRLELALSDFDIVQATQTVVADLGYKTQEKHINVAVATPPQPLSVHADRNKTHEILTNLLGNAIKFTPEGGRITISFEQKNNMIAISVTDTGIGIKKEDFPKLFTKFGRLDTSFSGISQVPGTGLGLFICKKIVELSGGTVSVDSTPGVGSTFTFTLPKNTKSN
jgi:signal transduction histidine kinase